MLKRVLRPAAKLAFTVAWHVGAHRVLPLGRFVPQYRPGNRQASELLRNVAGIEKHIRSMEKGSVIWPGVRMLEGRHLRNCRVVADRYEMLEHMPKGGVCAEVGIASGEYSERILKVTQPKALHLVELRPWWLVNAREKFAAEMKAGRVVTHQGDSSSVIRGLKDVRFDWVYIDGDHSYDGCRKDLEAVRHKMKPGGLIAVNDYAYFSALEMEKYGVVEAVNEFCLEHGYEMIYIALEQWGYNDVVLRPLGSGAGAGGGRGGTD